MSGIQGMTLFGTDDYASGSDSATTKTPVATTNAPTTSKHSGKMVVFPKLTSPIAQVHKQTKVICVPAPNLLQFASTGHESQRVHWLKASDLSGPDVH